jgi:hypothetical protein
VCGCVDLVLVVIYDTSIMENSGCSSYQVVPSYVTHPYP